MYVCIYACMYVRMYICMYWHEFKTFLLTGLHGIALISMLEHIIDGLSVMLQLGVRTILHVLLQVISQLMQDMYLAIGD